MAAFRRIVLRVGARPNLPALVALLAAAGCGGSPAPSAPGRGGASASSAAVASPPCASAAPSSGATYCEGTSEVGIPVGRGRRDTSALLVRTVDVVGNLARVATHYPSVDRAAGAGCSPPATGDGLGQPWRCEV